MFSEIENEQKIDEHSNVTKEGKNKKESRNDALARKRPYVYSLTV